MEAVPSRFWIFQAVPERYDLAQQLKPGRTENWVVSDFVTEIAPGDVVYLWQARSEAALFGWATVNSDVVEPRTTKGAPSSSDPGRSDFRVELLYQARFEPPISRTEVRASEKLADLIVLQTARGTNFAVEPEQAGALNELARTRTGASPPPTPATVPPPSDRSQEPITWVQLSRLAQAVFEWAAAAEHPHPRVGTRGLLIGLLKMSRSSEASQADELLKYAGVQREECFEALQEVRREVQINPTVGDPTTLTALPPLTPNGNRALDAAGQLREDPAALIEP